MDYQLLPAVQKNLQVVLNWIDSPEQLRLWGGPSLTYPPQVENLWREIHADETNTYVLVDASGNVAGFGQTLVHDPVTIHLARIILSPMLRGQGLGRLLVEKLITAGINKFHPSQITLNVYRNNDSALGLYRAMGFLVLVIDEERDSYKMGLKIE